MSALWERVVSALLLASVAVHLVVVYAVLWCWARMNKCKAMGNHPPAPDRFEMGDQRRFRTREYNGRWEVYAIGLEQWAECNTATHAQTVADALEAFYANIRNLPRDE